MNCNLNYRYEYVSLKCANAFLPSRFLLNAKSKPSILYDDNDMDWNLTKDSDLVQFNWSLINWVYGEWISDKNVFKLLKFQLTGNDGDCLWQTVLLPALKCSSGVVIVRVNKNHFVFDIYFKNGRCYTESVSD